MVSVTEFIAGEGSFVLEEGTERRLLDLLVFTSKRRRVLVAPAEGLSEGERLVAVGVLVRLLETVAERALDWGTATYEAAGPSRQAQARIAGEALVALEAEVGPGVLEAAREAFRVEVARLEAEQRARREPVRAPQDLAALREEFEEVARQAGVDPNGEKGREAWARWQRQQ